MDIIVNNRDKLDLTHRHYYDVGNSSLVLMLVLNITINDNVELFNALKDALSKERDISINVINPCKTKTLVKKVREEYSELDIRNKANAEMKRKQIEYHVEQLRLLGAMVKDIEYEEYSTPEEYLEIVSESSHHSHGRIEVTYRTGTEFHKCMLRNNIVNMNYRM